MHFRPINGIIFLTGTIEEKAQEQPHARTNSSTRYWESWSRGGLGELSRLRQLRHKSFSSKTKRTYTAAGARRCLLMQVGQSGPGKHRHALDCWRWGWLSQESGLATADVCESNPSLEVVFVCFLERFKPHSAGIGPLQRYSLRIFRYVHNLNASVGISVVSS